LTEQLTKVPQSAVLHNLSAEIWQSTPPTIPTRTKLLKSVGTAAQRALRHIIKNAVKEREAFLTELKSRLAQRRATKDTDPAAAIKNIDRQLNDTRRFQRIARAIKPQPSSSLTKVEIVHTAAHLHPVTGKVVETTTVKTVDTRKALEAAIIERNKRHFAQADGTPFTKLPLSKISSENGYNVFEDAAGHEILLPEDSFVETKMVMELLQARQRDPGTKWFEGVSFDEFISGLLHWNERTSTSPSGRYLGLYKALITSYCNWSGEFTTIPEDDDSDLTTQERAEQILELIHGLAAAAARQGFYLQRRWLHVVNVMI
jgi:hypothetical protein